MFRGAHGLVLSARSSFFAAALGLPSFVERGRRSVHLGIVEARKLRKIIVTRFDDLDDLMVADVADPGSRPLASWPRFQSC